MRDDRLAPPKPELCFFLDQSYGPVNDLSGLLRCKRTRHLAESFLMAFVVYAGEVPGNFQTHPLTCLHFIRVCSVTQTFEEVPDGHPKHLSDFKQTTGRDAVDTAFVFVGLLIGHTDQLGHLLLT